MKQTDLKVGGVYAYQLGRYYSPHKCEVVEKGLVVDRYSDRKQGVRIRFPDSREKIVPARRIIGSWATYEAEVARKEAVQEKVRRDRARKDKILLDRIDAVSKVPGVPSILIDSLKFNVQKRHIASTSVTLDQFESLLQGLRGFTPVPEDGKRCNACEERPAMEDSYLCEQCRYGVEV